MEKRFRIQLTEKELWILRRLVVSEYHQDRRNLRYERYRLKQGDSGSRFYPISEQEKHLKETRKLLKKLSRYYNEKWFIR